MVIYKQSNAQNITERARKDVPSDLKRRSESLLCDVYEHLQRTKKGADNFERGSSVLLLMNCEVENHKLKSLSPPLIALNTNS